MISKKKYILANMVWYGIFALFVAIGLLGYPIATLIFSIMSLTLGICSVICKRYNLKWFIFELLVFREIHSGCNYNPNNRYCQHNPSSVSLPLGKHPNTNTNTSNTSKNKSKHALYYRLSQMIKQLRHRRTDIIEHVFNTGKVKMSFLWVEDNEKNR
jgi:hypothetical protein